MTKHLLSVVAAVMLLQVCCISCRFYHTADTQDPSSEQHGYQEHQESEADTTYKVEPKASQKDAEAMQLLSSVWSPLNLGLNLPQTKQSEESDDPLLRYFYQFIGNLEALDHDYDDKDMEIKRGGRYHKPDGRIRLLKISL